MQIEREQTGTLTAKLKLVLHPEDYNPGVEQALKEQRRTTAWPGFRPGHVPMSIVRKRVGKAVLVNEVERIVGRSLQEYIDQNRLRVLGQPLPQLDLAETNNWDEPGEFRFAYEMGLAPDLDVELGKGLDVAYPVMNVDDGLVDREVADLQRRFGTLEEVAASEEKDMLLGDMIELNADGSIREGGIFQRATITLEFLKDEATRKALTGRAAGDEVKVDPHMVSDGHEDLARMLNVDHERVHHLHGEMLFRIAEIKRLRPLDLGQPLFDRVFGAGEVADEAAFRERVRQRLEGMFGRDSDRIFRRIVISKLLEKNKVELPDTFLKRWIRETSENPLTPEQVEEGYAGYATGLRRQLVEDRVVEQYGLEAKAEELQAFAWRYVADQFAQYGMAPDESRVQEIAGRMLGDRDQVRRMRDSIVEQKLITHFKTLLTPKEHRIGYEEFVNLARTA
ncbi:MAG: hypothetical protein JNM31_07025 [Flavobacteriales bacterium]|nr:hypothetical protein [Flavobacteriales bacterium]